MKLQKKPFESILSGNKIIEMRLYDDKRKQLQIGDNIVFSQYDDCNKKIETKIVKLHLFKNFKELYQHFDKKYLGYLESENANYLDMEKYYSKEEQDNFGVIGIEIELL